MSDANARLGVAGGRQEEDKENRIERESEIEWGYDDGGCWGTKMKRIFEVRVVRGRAEPRRVQSRLYGDLMWGGTGWYGFG